MKFQKIKKPKSNSKQFNIETEDYTVELTFKELKTMSVWVKLCICLAVFISYLSFTYGILYLFNIDQKLLNMVPFCLAFTATLLMWKAMK